MGFQTGHYGLFLVSALGGVAFWSLEAAFKSFQMRYYVRMREIEVRQAELAAKDGGGQVFAPQIDWSWRTAGEYFSGRRKPEEAPGSPRRYGRSLGFLGAWLLPQVFLPHVISMVAGGILFALGMEGVLPMKL